MKSKKKRKKFLRWKLRSFVEAQNQYLKNSAAHTGGISFFACAAQEEVGFGMRVEGKKARKQKKKTQRMMKKMKSQRAKFLRNVACYV